MKKVTLGGFEFELTDEKIRRVKDAIKETQDKLNKELAYSVDLQKPEVIERYKKHISNLEGVIS